MTDHATPPSSNDERRIADLAVVSLLAQLQAAEQQRDEYKALALAAEGVLVDAPALAVRERERAERAEAALDRAERDLAWVQTAVASNSAVCEACAAEIARVCGWGVEEEA